VQWVADGTGCRHSSSAVPRSSTFGVGALPSTVNLNVVLDIILCILTEVLLTVPRTWLLHHYRTSSSANSGETEPDHHNHWRDYHRARMLHQRSPITALALLAAS